MSTKSTPLIDPFQRRLRYLRISITDFCNFKCNYCLPDGYQGKRPTNELTLNEIGNLVAGFAALGTEKVRITGGEPTLRKDFTDIIQACKAPANITKVAMTSNGWQLEKNHRAWAQAGLDQLNLSIDSLDEKTFHQITGKNSLHSILNGIDSILSDGNIKLKINAVLLKSHNKKQIDDALHFVKDRPISLRFIELMQTGENQDLFKSSHLTGAKVVNHLTDRGWKPRPRELDAGPAIEYTHQEYQGRIGVIAPYSKDFCKKCNRLRVTAQGNMYLCLFDSLAFNIRPYLVDNQHEQFKAHIRSLIEQKPESHYLKNDYVGLIKNLSMIGG